MDNYSEYWNLVRISEEMMPENGSLKVIPLFFILALALVFWFLFFGESGQRDLPLPSDSLKFESIPTEKSLLELEQSNSISQEVESPSILRDSVKSQNSRSTEAPSPTGGKPLKPATRELPEDLRLQLESPPPELPDDLRKQLESPPPELPEDIKRSLEQGPRRVTVEEVNDPNFQP